MSGEDREAGLHDKYREAFERPIRAAMAEVEAEMAEHRERADSNFDNALMWRERAEKAEATVERVRALGESWEGALDSGCPSCGPFTDDCDHIEGYHHALSDLWAALDGAGERDRGEP